MAQAVNVNFKLDPDTKKSFEEVCSEMGLSVSAALTVFVKKVSRENPPPSETTANPSTRNAKTRHLESIVRDIKSGKAHFTEHELIEVD